MAERDENLRKRLGQAATDDVSRARWETANDGKPHGPATGPALPPAVSLMITNRQRAALRELGFSEDAIRQMTPSEAHGKLGLA